jgi:hypothetical protein
MNEVLVIPARRDRRKKEPPMGRAFADIAFTSSVRAAQTRYGSREANWGLETVGDRQDEISDFERGFTAGLARAGRGQHGGCKRRPGDGGPTLSLRRMDTAIRSRRAPARRVL